MILGRKLKNLIENWKNFLKESSHSAEYDSAHIVLSKNKQILIVRRTSNDRWMPHHYAFPGGKIETGEDVVAGLCRECKEEVNLTVKPENCHFLSDVSKKLGHKFYLATDFDGDVHLNNEHDDFKWINPKDISNFKTVPDLIDVVAAVKESI